MSSLYPLRNSRLRFSLISHSFSVQYVFVVMLVFVLEAGVGALARLYEEQVGPELKMNLNRTFLEDYSVRSRETTAIDQMQIEVSTDRRPRRTT